MGSIVSRTACLGAELHLRLLVRPRGKVVVLAQEVVIVCLCLKDTEIHATSKQGNTTNSALESLHSLHRSGSRVTYHMAPDQKVRHGIQSPHYYYIFNLIRITFSCLHVRFQNAKVYLLSY